MSVARVRTEESRKQAEEWLVPLTVRLTAAELTALSYVAVAVTSAVDVVVVNAADRGLRKVREAAANYIR